MKEQKILAVHLKDDRILLIVCDNIQGVEQLPSGHTRIYYGNQFIDIDRHIEWMQKFLEGDEFKKECHQLKFA